MTTTVSRAIVVLVLCAILPLTGGGASDAAQKVRVVTTISDLKALTEAVGGDLVDVESLTRGTQNFHDAEVRPSMMLKLRRADLLVENGLALDAWVDVAIQGANNGNLVRGAPGRIEAARGVPLLDVPTGRVDRSMGDVHPHGNPHVTLDPGAAPVITRNIAAGLAAVAPSHRAAFEKNREAFLAKLDGEMARWSKMMEPVRGAKVVVYHPTFAYFLARFGLVQAGTVEDRPGIPPSPAHLARLIQQMRGEKVKAVLVEPWSDRKLAERVAQEAGARAVVVAPAVGAVPGADTYLAAVDYNIRTLADVLK